MDLFLTRLLPAERRDFTLDVGRVRIGGMSSAEARTAYADAKKFAESLRAIHEREMKLLAKIENASDRRDLTSLHKEMIALRSIWSNLLGRYTEAIARFSAAVEAARKAQYPR
jgi:hypothetical protein